MAESGLLTRTYRIPINKPGDGRTLLKTLMAINSEAFMYWQTNFDTVTSLVEEAKTANQPDGH